MTKSFLSSTCHLPTVGLILGSAFFGYPAYGQSLTVPLPGCRCPEGYVPIGTVCVELDALLTNQSDVGSIMEFERHYEAVIRRVCPELICETEIRGSVDDVVVLDNGAIVEGGGPSLHSRDDAILYRNGATWHLFVEDDDSESVELVREPSHCRAPTTYPLSTSPEPHGRWSAGLLSYGDLFSVGNDQFEARTGCSGWRDGDRIVVMDSVCVSTTLLNVTRSESCQVWCR